MSLFYTIRCLILFQILFVNSLIVRILSEHAEEEEAGPLLLSQFIKNGSMESGRRKSRVTLSGFEDIESYSGFITVNGTNSNLFFWFFKSKECNAPLVIWLQGGPGSSSLIGVFYENGPFVISDNQIMRRNHSWTDMFHMLYIDSPVGSGFSFTENTRGYASKQSQITDQLFEFLQQFLELFPDQRSNDLYLMGESYGCKHVVDLAFKIHTRNDSNMNLKGLMIGSGFCDPPLQSKYGEFLFNKGLIDSRNLSEIESKEKELLELLSHRKFRKAFYSWNSILDSFSNINLYNYKNNETLDDSDKYCNVINETKYRKALHVGNTHLSTNEDGNLVMFHLRSDFMRSVKSKLPVLMDNYKVLFLNGDLDVITSANLADKLIDSIEWKFANEYRNVSASELKVRNETVGYLKTCRNFTRAVLFEAGHMTAHDQPLANYLLIKQFAGDECYTKLIESLQHYFSSYVLF